MILIKNHGVNLLNCRFLYEILYRKKGGIFYKRILLYKESAIYKGVMSCVFFKDGGKHNTKKASVYYEDGEKTFHLKNDFYFSISKKDISFYNDDFFFFF